MFDPLLVIASFLLYIGCLFLIALWVERKGRGRRLANSAVVYSISLAVYCTSWTYYGSVGKAATSGMLFLTIYLGPTLAIILWWMVLRKLVRIKNTHRITSIADFISARYDRSQALAAIATVVALVGIMPYIALQLKAVTSTFAIITTPSGTAPPWIGRYVDFIVIGLMVLFTIIFGVRRLDPTERHEGMVMALAVECMVKLVAFLAAGIFVTYFMYDGFGDIFQRLSESPFRELMSSGGTGTSSYLTWTSYLVLATSAILFLPRQFHIAVVENSDEKHIRAAMWLFPLYMFLINIFVFPIAMGGLLKGYPVQEADTFVLGLSLHHGEPWLAMLVFIGGFSAATGMIMISSMTLSTMITNHLLLPLMGWVRRLSFLRRHLLKCKWVAVAVVLLLGYWFEWQVGESYMLVNIGMISFAAVLQFAPAILGGIFWRQGNKAGALLGLSAGFLVWFYTLLLPSFVRSGWIAASLLETGPWGIAFLKPEQLFGLVGFDSLSHAVFWTMFFNVGLYVLGSLCFKQSKEEQSLAEEFVGALAIRAALSRPMRGEAYIALAEKRGEIENLLSQYFIYAKAVATTQECISAVGIEGKSRIAITELIELHDEVEKCLTGSIGAAAAREAVKEGIVFTARESRELSEVYSEILADLKVTPDELRTKIDYYQEKETLLTSHAKELEEKVEERDEQIIERKRAEEELRKHREHLEELVTERTAELVVAKEQALEAQRTAEAANRAKSTFLANMSHELRTPLNAILGFAQIMRRDPAIPARQQENLKTVSRSGEYLLSLLSDVLEMSRIEAGRTTLSESCFDLHRALDDLEGMMRLRAERKGLRLVFNRAPNVPQYIKTDERKLRQVLINLLGNAVKFTEEGGVALRVASGEWQVASEQLADGSTEASTVSVASLPAEPLAEVLQTCKLEFEIEDTGVGIAPEEIDTLFEAFIQTQSGQRAQEGTGLGLPISRQFVQLMGGDITASSRVGQGSIFKFDIQIKLAETTEIEAREPTHRVIGLEPNQPSYRILVVEDRLESRILLRELLEGVGFTVQEAVNGQHAVELHESWHPHLIWMDMRMPVMDGYEATRQIKGTTQGQATVIIALTASAFEEDRAVVLSAGCDDFVRKPFREAVIFDRMAQHLGVRYVYEELAQPAEQEEARQVQAALTPATLAALPADWVTDLHHAATRGKAKQILELIDQIQPDHVVLAKALAALVDEFRFDKIVALTEQYCQGGNDEQSST